MLFLIVCRYRLCRPVAGAALNALGAGLKCAAVGRERFAVLMAAQVVCACAQLFILGLPARVAAVWFGEAELATATSIGVFGNQVWPCPFLPPLRPLPRPSLARLRGLAALSFCPHILNRCFLFSIPLF